MKTEVFYHVFHNLESPVFLKFKAPFLCEIEAKNKANDLNKEFENEPYKVVREIRKYEVV